MLAALQTKKGRPLHNPKRQMTTVHYTFPLSSSNLPKLLQRLSPLRIFGCLIMRGLASQSRNPQSKATPLPVDSRFGLRKKEPWLLL